MRKDSGFTMIELMVVIGIMAILSAIAIPSYIKWLPKHRVGSAARAVMSAMEFARSNAIKRNTVVRVDFDWANESLTVVEVVNLARTMADANQKLVWGLGPTEHCRTCLKLDGKVKRAEVWAAANIRPQSPDLACGGWRCQCTLEPTDAPASPGPLPRIP